VDRPRCFLRGDCKKMDSFERHRADFNLVDGERNRLLGCNDEVVAPHLREAGVLAVPGVGRHTGSCETPNHCVQEMP